jgi:hypothetical protein
MPLIAATEPDTSDFWTMNNEAGRKANRAVVPPYLKIPGGSSLTLLKAKDTDYFIVCIHYGINKLTSILCPVRIWEDIPHNSPLGEWFSERIREAVSHRKIPERAYRGWLGELEEYGMPEHPDILPF